MPAINQIPLTISNDYYSVGGLTTNDVASRTFKVLAFNANINATGAAFKEGASSYQVPVGKTFNVLAIHLIAAANVAHTAYLCYADDALMANNKVAMGFTFPSSLAIAVTYFEPWALPLSVPASATKYIGIYNAAAVAASFTVMLYGYEV